jgi:hypothetical protein
MVKRNPSAPGGLDGGEADAAFLAAAGENLAAAGGRHARAESELADPLDL